MNRLDQLRQKSLDHIERAKKLTDELHIERPDLPGFIEPTSEAVIELSDDLGKLLAVEIHCKGLCVWCRQDRSADGFSSHAEDCPWFVAHEKWLGE